MRSPRANAVGNWIFAIIVVPPSRRSKATVAQKIGLDLANAGFASQKCGG